METIIGILSILIVLAIVSYTAYKAKGFMGRLFNSKNKERKSEGGPELINRMSPFNAQADFEAALEMSAKAVEAEEAIEKFEPVDLHLEDETEIVLLPRNPYWLYSYWHIKPETIDEFNAKYGENSWEYCTPYLKLLNITHNKEYFIPITNFAASWYIKVGDPCCSWQLIMGKMVPEVGFVAFAHSNTAITPPVQPSSIIDPEWIPVSEIWTDILEKGYKTGFLTGMSSEELINLHRKDD
ncbi:MAG: DUF4912 domain-containing protein [Bacillota bacterium]